MIQEAYVSFEIAKLLKKKGFDVPCNSWYIPYSDGSVKECMLAEPVNYNHYDGFPWTVSRPTHQMACAWLREEYLLHIEIIVNPIDKGRERTDEWYYGFTIHNPRTGTTEGDSGENKYAAYEDAVEAAIRYTLEYLI